MMKKLAIVFFVVVNGMSACKNFDIEHPPFDYTSVYFSNQFPVRTIILGDYLYPNENDNAFKCVIYAHIAGVYNNKSDRKISIEVDDNLCDDLLFSGSGGNAILPMPKNYYTLSSATELVIPKGKMMGGVEVQLSDAFFEDPASIKNTYVIPIRLTDTKDVDSILMGRPREGLSNPDVRIMDDWEIAPKFYTLYCVKFINEYDAVYLHYGDSKVSNATETKEDSVYKEKHVEFNRTLKLATTGRRIVQSMDIPFRSILLKGMYQLQLDFDGSNKCTISGAGEYSRDAKIDNPDFDPNEPDNDDNPSIISVTYNTIYRVVALDQGEYVAKSDDPYTSWSDQTHGVINNLKYRVVVDTTDDPDVDPSLVYEAKETMVYQLRDVVFEEYLPTKEP